MGRKLLLTFSKIRVLWIGLILWSTIFAYQIYAFGYNNVEIKHTTVEIPTFPKEEVTPPYLDDIPGFLSSNNIENIENYVAWAASNLKYVPDHDRDKWAYPLRTIEKKYGDCEDLAFLHAAVLDHFKYKPRVLAFGKGKQAHVFTVYSKDGQFYLFDNVKHYKTNVTNIQDFAKFLAIKYKTEYFLELHLVPKKISVLFVTKPRKS